MLQLIGEPPIRKAVTLNSTSPNDSTLTSIWLDGLAGIAAWLMSFWVLLPGGKKRKLNFCSSSHYRCALFLIQIRIQLAYWIRIYIWIQVRR